MKWRRAAFNSVPLSRGGVTWMEERVVGACFWCRRLRCAGAEPVLVAEPPGQGQPAPGWDVASEGCDQTPLWCSLQTPLGDLLGPR